MARFAPRSQFCGGVVARFHILPPSKGDQKTEKAGDEQDPRAAGRRAIALSVIRDGKIK
jgi:hypothetical protein